MVGRKGWHCSVALQIGTSPYTYLQGSGVSPKLGASATNVM